MPSSRPSINSCDEVVRLLRENDDNVNVTNKKGWTPLNAASRNSITKWSNYFPERVPMRWLQTRRARCHSNQPLIMHVRVAKLHFKYALQGALTLSVQVDG